MPTSGPSEFSSVPGVEAKSDSIYVIIRLSGANPNEDEHWRSEPWGYAKAVKWFEDVDEALAEAARLNSLHDDPLHVYFVSHPKPGKRVKAPVLTFGDRVTVTVADGSMPDLFEGDEGEVVGMSNDGLYVGVMVDRIERVYTLSVNDVQKQ